MGNISIRKLWIFVAITAAALIALLRVQAFERFKFDPIQQPLHQEERKEWRETETAFFNDTSNHKTNEQTTESVTSATKTDGPPWLRKSKPMSRLVETTLRCSAEYHGVFRLLPNLSPQSLQASKDQCLYACFSGGYLYAGIGQNKKCYCKHTLRRFVTNQLLPEIRKLMLGSEIRFPEIKIYRKSLGCQTAFSRQSLKESQIGCMPVPDKLRDSMKSWTMKNMEAQQCILQCEQHGYLVAMPVKKYDSCVCSDLLSMFVTANRMYAVMNSCEKKHKPGDKELHAVYRTYAENKQCEPKGFLKQKNINHTVIASLPGSGNTWLRHLIETATGIYTGSRYNDHKLYRGGMLGELLPTLSGKTIAIKDHLFRYKIDENYTSAICLIRNIYNRVLADFAREQAHSHTQTIDSNLYASTDFKKFARAKPHIWTTTQRYIFGNISSALVVYFEDIQKDPVGQMRRIIQFLPNSEIPKSGPSLEKRLMCMILDLTGNFKRPPKRLESNPFDDDLMEIYDQSIKDMDTMMQEHHQLPIPLSYYDKRV